MRKVENFIFVLFSIVASFICLYNIYNDEEKIKSDVIDSINKNISLISEYARNLSINFDKSGTVKLNALYKGAHGESNPNEFNYNFKMDNGIITLENEQGFVNYDLSKIYNLVNNTDGNKEIYLYLTNDLFMISGYNLTKLGNFDENSTTIRAYNESAFNLSSKDMPTVCSFSGFNQCFNLQNELV